MPSCWAPCAPARGPRFLCVRTYRLTGHTGADPAAYRPTAEVEARWKGDPIARLAAHLRLAGVAEADLAADAAAAQAEMRRAYDEAVATPYPAAKARYMFGGQSRVPVVVREPIGLWRSSAAQHSQSLEAWYAHIPGLVVVCPSTPADNKGLLKSAIRCDDPVVYMEHKSLWPLEGEVSAGTAT